MTDGLINNYVDVGNLVGRGEPDPPVGDRAAASPGVTVSIDANEKRRLHRSSRRERNGESPPSEARPNEHGRGCVRPNWRSSP